MNILGFAGQVWSLSHICMCVCVCAHVRVCVRVCMCSVKTILVQGLDKSSLCGLDLAQGTCLQTPNPSEKARHRCVNRGQAQPRVACAGHTCVSAETTWREGWAWGGFLEVTLESRLRSCQSGPRSFTIWKLFIFLLAVPRVSLENHCCPASAQTSAHQGHTSPVSVKT